MLPVSGAEQLQASLAIVLRPMISASGAYSTFDRPAPHSGSGWNRFQSPRRFASAFISSMIGGCAFGLPASTSWCSYSASFGYTHSSMKASNCSRYWFVRSVKAKSMPRT